MRRARPLDGGWTGGEEHPGVVRTFVLRLLGERGARDDVVGEVEDVATGETALVKSAEELVAFVGRARPEEQEDDSQREQGGRR